MHRHDVKLESYCVLKDALSHLDTPDWSLVIVGDGVAHQTVRDMYAEFGDRISFTGKLDRPEIDIRYREADIFVWPGVNEAFGMVYLEAQLAGLPVVAENRPGVREVIGVSESLIEQGNPARFADAIRTLLNSEELRQNRGQKGYEFVVENHLRDTASGTLAEQIGFYTQLTVPENAKKQSGLGQNPGGGN